MQAAFRFVHHLSKGIWVELPNPSPREGRTSMVPWESMGIASLLLVAMLFVPSSFLLLVVRPGGLLVASARVFCQLPLSRSETF